MPVVPSQTSSSQNSNTTSIDTSASLTSEDSTSVPTSEPTSEITSAPTSTQTSTSTSVLSSEPTSVPTSMPTSVPTSAPTSTSISISTSSSSISSSTSAPLQLRTIADIKQNGIDGELVYFEATYLRQVTHVNIDLMYFADAHDTIWLKVPYESFTGHLAGIYHMRECRVKGILSKTEKVIEVVYSADIGKNDSVVNLGDNYPLSYNAETSPISVAGIAEIKAKSAQIPLDSKYYGAGELVKFTSQYVEREEDDGGIKTMVLDSDGNSVVVIADGKKLLEQNDVGKYYEFVGIISVRLSIPAILAISATFVSDSNVVDVSNAVEVSPSYFAKWNLTSDKFSPASNDEYYKLFKITGYVKDYTNVTTSYNLGMVDTYSEKLSANGKNTVKGIYFVNGTGLKTLDYCVFADYLDQNVPLTIYAKIESYHTSHHLWKMFTIESLVPELN